MGNRFVNKIWNLLGVESDDEYEDEYYEGDNTYVAPEEKEYTAPAPTTLHFPILIPGIIVAPAPRTSSSG